MKDFFLWLKKTFTDPKIFTYPITVFSVAILVVVYLMVKVIPAFADVFAGFGAKLPFPTLCVIFISKNLWIVFIFLAVFLEFAYLKWKGIIKLSWLKEWMLILFFGLLLGFIVVAMYLPMFELGNLPDR